MAEYICKNGILRPINHIYQCTSEYVVELYEGIRIPNGCSFQNFPSNINITDNAVVTLECPFMDWGNTSNRHFFNVYTGTNYTYSANVDTYSNKARSTSQGSYGQPSFFIENVSKATFEIGATYIAVNGKKYNGSVSRIKILAWWGSLVTYMFYGRIALEGSYDLRPCRLAADIDAKYGRDGKPHYEGEVGFWNMLTKKFHHYISGGAPIMYGELLETLRGV